MTIWPKTYYGLSNKRGGFPVISRRFSSIRFVNHFAPRNRQQVALKSPLIKLKPLWMVSWSALVEFYIERPYYPSNSVRVMFLNFVSYERTGFLHVLKIGCCFRWFKQILGRNITSLTRLRSWRYKFSFISHWQILHWSLAISSVLRFVLTEVNMCKKQGFLLLANLLIRRQSPRVKKRWAFFKNRGLLASVPSVSCPNFRAASLWKIVWELFFRTETLATQANAGLISL